MFAEPEELEIIENSRLRSELSADSAELEEIEIIENSRLRSELSAE